MADSVEIAESCGCSCCGTGSTPPTIENAHASTTEQVGGVDLWLQIAGVGVFVAGIILPLFVHGLPNVAVTVLFAVAYLLIGGEVLVSAVRNIVRGQVFDENFLMAIASIGAFAIGQHTEAVAVMLFYRVGEFFQDRAVARSRRSIADLMDIRPDFARRPAVDAARLSAALAAAATGADLSEVANTKVAPAEIAVGETILVRFGDKVPLDGTVIAGATTLDTAALTGEATPRAVSVGDPVLSGTINLGNTFAMRTDAAFAASTVSKIARLVAEAAQKKAPVEQFITRFARVYTPAVVAIAALLAVLPPLLVGGGAQAWSEWFGRALIFLVVSCPCALVISIPLTYFGGIGAASRTGILVKGGNYLDALTRVKTIVYDKTGTLTTTGYRGREHVGETLKVDSADAIARLRAAGVHTQVMLSGDTQAVADRFAEQAGLDAAYGDLLPGDKVARFEELQAAARQRGGGGAKELVAFVGDGVNDAPVLARADVGIAMGALGTDAAVEAADIVLMTDEPSKIVAAKAIAARTRSIVNQNIVFALGVKLAIMVLAAFGVSTMWEAVFGDVGVALLATLNAARIIRVRG
ncbi:MAG: HAD-IC family P-type ATPase [Actinomycetes bacterium]|jgi:Cd2+/Zn2+-exporting ATPase|nr:HAD-IC family P-type ATPase [Actinomycetes bacterium]